MQSHPHNVGGAGAMDADVVQTQDNVPGRVRLRCMVMKSNAAGIIAQAESCDDWVPLAR